MVERAALMKHTRNHHLRFLLFFVETKNEVALKTEQTRLADQRKKEEEETSKFVAKRGK